MGFFQNDREKNKGSFYFPFKNKKKEKSFVIRRENSNISSDNKKLQELRVSTVEMQSYVDKKASLFEKLNKFPFDFKTKRTIFYFPKEKLLENLKKKNAKEANNSSNLFERRYSAETGNEQILKAFKQQRSNSKPNTSSYHNNSSLERKGNFGSYLAKSQRYTNALRPSTNQKIKNLVVKKIQNNSHEGFFNNGLVFLDLEENPYQIKQNLRKGSPNKTNKILKNLKKIVRKV